HPDCALSPSLTRGRSLRHLRRTRCLPRPHSRHLRPLHSFPTRRSSDLSPFQALSKAVVDNLRVKLGPWFLEYDNDKSRNVAFIRSEEHTSELQSRFDLVCRLLLENNNSETHGGALRAVSRHHARHRGAR